MARSDPDGSGAAGAPRTLERERELAVEMLSQQFAVDNITLDDLEQRMERVYRARSVAALRDVTRDLASTQPEADAPAGAAASRRLQQREPYPAEHARIVSVMAETRRRDLWQLPRTLDVWSVMAETTLDLTQSQLAPGVAEIRVHGIMAAVKIIVPPGLRIVVQPSAFMSSVSDDVIDQPPVGTGAPVVRVTGRLIMAELKVRVRRRELDPGE